MTLPPLPCPFCGSTNIRTDDARDFLACMDCHAEGPGNIGMGSNYAVEAWNRRAAIAAHVPEAECGNIAAVPAQPGIRTLSSAQIERHTLTASECPPDSAVMLVSSINRLLGKSRGEGIQFVLPVLDCDIQPRPLAYPLTDYYRAGIDGPLHYMWKDKPHRLLYDLIAAVRYYAAPQAVPVPAGWSVTYDGKRASYIYADQETAEFEAQQVGGTARAVAVYLAAAPKEQPHE